MGIVPACRGVPAAKLLFSRTTAPAAGVESENAALVGLLDKPEHAVNEYVLDKLIRSRSLVFRRPPPPTAPPRVIPLLSLRILLAAELASELRCVPSEGGNGPPNGVRIMTWCADRRRTGGWISCRRES